MKKSIYIYTVVGLVTIFSHVVLAETTPNSDSNKVLSKQTVIEWVMANNLELKALESEVRSKEALVRQVKAWRNPEFEVEAENVLGTGANKGFDSAETTYKLSEEFELWGKRGFRIQTAELELVLSQNHYHQFMLALLKRVDDLYGQVMAAQEKVLLAQEKVELNKSLMMEIKRMVKAGRFSSVEEKRTHIRLSKSILAEKKSKKELMIFKHQLSLLWGNKTPLFEEVEKTKLDPETEEMDSLSMLQEQLALGPESKRLDIESELVLLHLKKDQSEALPNLTLSGGIKDSRADNAQTWVLGAAFPFPIFDRNGGQIESAKANLEQKDKETEVSKRALLLQLTELYHQKELIRENLVSLKTSIIPDSQDVYQSVRKGYLKGRYSYLDLFDAQDSLFELRQNYAEAVADFYRIRAEIWALIGNEIKLKGETP
jgi:cobalt-zinc-cadmium efflux system outer membrane protein